MLKRVVILLISLLFVNISIAQNETNNIITKEQRCEIAEDNLRVLSDISKPIYRQDINGNRVELTYAETLKERQDSENLIKTVCVSDNEKFEQEPRSFGTNLINRARNNAVKDHITIALEQALIIRNYDEVYTILVYVVGIDTNYAIKFINIARLLNTADAILLYNQKYKDKKDKSNKSDAEKAEDKYKKPISGSGKEKASNVPTWAKGKRPYKWENGKDFARRLMDERYGKGKWERVKGRGIRSDGKGRYCEFCEIHKHGDRGFK